MQIKEVMTREARYVPAGTTLKDAAAGLDPDKATVDQVLSERVLYCFEDDDIETAARSMQEQQVYRLVVLDGPDSKRLSGVISLGDLMRNDHIELAKKTAAAIAEAA